MKGIVVEIHNHTAAVLSEEGCVVKVRNHNYHIGQEVVCMKKQITLNKKVIAFASAAASFVIILGIGAYTYATPYAYVSLDVNPSIEYSVNRFDRVIKVSGVNDDGNDIINEVDLNNLENKSIEDAVSLTIDEISDAGYFDTEEGGIVISTSADDMEKADELAKFLEEAANTRLEKNDHQAVVTAEAVGLERVEKAKELGVTPGKLNIVEKLMKSAGDSETIDMNEWLNKSVKDIMAQTKAYKVQNKEKEKNMEAEQKAGEATPNQEQNQAVSSESAAIDAATTPSEAPAAEEPKKDNASSKKKPEKERSTKGNSVNTDNTVNTDADTNNTITDNSNSNTEKENGNSSSAGSNANTNANANSDSEKEKGNSSSAGSDANTNANANSDSEKEKGNSSSAGSDNSQNANSEDKGNASKKNADENESSNSNSEDKGNSSDNANGKKGKN